jgi:hypothetical protein
MERNDGSRARGARGVGDSGDGRSLGGDLLLAHRSCEAEEGLRESDGAQRLQSRSRRSWCGDSGDGRSLGGDLLLPHRSCIDRRRSPAPAARRHVGAPVRACARARERNDCSRVEALVVWGDSADGRSLGGDLLLAHRSKARRACARARERNDCSRARGARGAETQATADRSVAISCSLIEARRGGPARERGSATMAVAGEVLVGRRPKRGALDTDDPRANSGARRGVEAALSRGVAEAPGCVRARERNDCSRRCPGERG